MCHVCRVPVAIPEVEKHEAGRAHLWKAVHDSCLAAHAAGELTSPSRVVQRSFVDGLRAILQSLRLPPLRVSGTMKPTYSPGRPILSITPPPFLSHLLAGTSE